MSASEPLTRMKHTVLLAMALNTDKRWFTPVELQHCTRTRSDTGAAERLETAVRELAEEGKVGIGRLVVGAWHVPMIRAINQDMLPWGEAMEIKRQPAYRRWSPKAFASGQPPLHLVPDDLAIPPIPTSAETVPS
jgi:hypothetical protein